MVTILEKLFDFIELEKGKAGFHEHDGWPEHPVAVKHHQEYFTAKHVPYGTPEEKKKPTKEQITYEGAVLNDEQVKLKELFDQKSEGTTFKISNTSYEKVSDDKWKNLNTKKIYDSTLLGYAWGDAQGFIDAIQETLSEPQEKTPTEIPFGDIITDKNEISLAGAKEQDKQDIQNMLDALPVGSKYVLDNKTAYTKLDNEDWQHQEEFGKGTAFPSYPSYAIAASIQNAYYPQQLELPIDEKPVIQPLLPERIGDIEGLGIKQFMEDAPVGTKIIPASAGNIGYVKTSDEEWNVLSYSGEILSEGYGDASLALPSDFANISDAKGFFSGIEYPDEKAPPAANVFSVAHLKGAGVGTVDSYVNNLEDGTKLYEPDGTVWTKDILGHWESSAQDDWAIDKYEMASKLQDGKIAEGYFPSEEKASAADEPFFPKTNWDNKLEKIGGQLGSQPGAQYEDKNTGQKYYIKTIPIERASMEHLAGQLYKLVGVSTPETEMIDFQGEKALKSMWLDDPKSMTFSSMKAQPEVIKNFAIDAWLANWDVVGQDADNIVMVNNQPFRIDSGGSLMFRAQGGIKDFGAEVKELKTMLDSATAPQTSKVFGDMPEETQKELFSIGARKLAKITDEQIDSIVYQVQSVPGDWNHKKLAQVLKDRRDFIAQAFDIGKRGRKKKECPPGFHRHDKFLQCHPETQKHRGDKVDIAFDIPKFLGKHRNKKIKQLFDGFQESITDSLNNRSEIEEMARDEGIYNEAYQMMDFSDSWQGGGGFTPVGLRAAISELKGNADRDYVVEGGYFIHQQKVDPDTFDRKFTKARENAIGLIPLIVKTQKALKKRFPDGKAKVYRGVEGWIADSIKNAMSSMPTKPIPIPHDGISGYSLNEATARDRAGSTGVMLVKEIPIEGIWIFFNTYGNRYPGEEEVLVDSNYVSLFQADEIISKN